MNEDSWKSCVYEEFHEHFLRTRGLPGRRERKLSLCQSDRLWKTAFPTVFDPWFSGFVRTKGECQDRRIFQRRGKSMESHLSPFLSEDQEGTAQDARLRRKVRQREETALKKFKGSAFVQCIWAEMKENRGTTVSSTGA